MTLTLAQQFVTAWANRKTTFSCESLARRLDPKVLVAKHQEPKGAIYDFSDNSRAWTEGTGKSHRIWTAGGFKPRRATA